MMGMFSDLALTPVKSSCGYLRRRGTTVTNPCCLGRFSEICTVDPINLSKCAVKTEILKNVFQFQVLRKKDDKLNN